MSSYRKTHVGAKETPCFAPNLFRQTPEKEGSEETIPASLKTTWVSKKKKIEKEAKKIPLLRSKSFDFDDAKKKVWKEWSESFTPASLKTILFQIQRKKCKERSESFNAASLKMWILLPNLAERTDTGERKKKNEEAEWKPARKGRRGRTIMEESERKIQKKSRENYRADGR